LQKTQGAEKGTVKREKRPHHLSGAAEKRKSGKRMTGKEKGGETVWPVKRIKGENKEQC